jgi:hypothetical protein
VIRPQPIDWGVAVWKVLKTPLFRRRHADLAGVLRQSVLILAAGFVIGAVFLLQFGKISVERPIASYFFVTQDAPWLGVYAALLAAALLRMPAFVFDRPSLPRLGDSFSRHAAVIAATAVFVVCYGGSALVHHGFAWTMDEFAARFDANIFAEGELLATLPPEWRPYATAMQPPGIFVSQDQHLWASSYYPINAALLAIGRGLADKVVVNALLAAFAVLMLDRVARQLWPDRTDARTVAIVMLVSSTQFLFTAMTYYAMTPHLAFSLAWLWLFLRDDRVGHSLAPWVGIVATGLHQLIFHPLFALPFLVSLLTRRRWRLVLYYAAVYGLGALFWL